MRPVYLYITCIVITVVGLVFVGFLYTTQPRSFAEVSTKGQVAIGAYSIDKAQFEQGLADFRRDAFPDARGAFERADPERRDASVQFYIAYSYYRQGWGRVYNDNTLFQAGLEAVNRVVSLDPGYRTTDETLQLKTAVELKDELEEGLKVTPSDFNPMKVLRERK